jgi:hypothetical protein
MTIPIGIYAIYVVFSILGHSNSDLKAQNAGLLPSTQLMERTSIDEQL